MSTIRGVNLLPLARRRAARRRLRTRLWAAVGAAWAGTIIAVYIPFAATKQREDAAIEGGMAQVSQRIDSATKILAALRSQNLAAVTTLTAARAVADHPDWGVLLDMLGRTRGEGIVLERVELTPVSPSSARAQAPADPAVPHSGGLAIGIEGAGESPSAVTEFTLKLERSGLFDRVTLLETKARSLRGSDRTSFKLQCTIGPAEPGSPRP